MDCFAALAMMVQCGSSGDGAFLTIRERGVLPAKHMMRGDARAPTKFNGMNVGSADVSANFGVSILAFEQRSGALPFKLGLYGPVRPEMLLPNPNYLQTQLLLLFRTQFPVVCFQFVFHVSL
jgi:hypothetical protein